MSVDDLKELATLLNIGIPVVAALIVFALCVCHADKLFLILSHVQKAMSFVSSKARKGAIANSIRGNILKSSKAFRSIGQDVIVPDLKIDWVKEENEESFIKNNQAIIRMHQNSNPHQNYVTAVNAYVGQALLPRAKQYIDRDIYNISKLSVGRFLVVNGDTDALDYFDKNMLLPVIDADENAKDIFERLQVIDKNGMFINILLNEYAKAGAKIYPDLPDPLLIAESKELLIYLYRIAIGNVSDLTEFQFNREYFKIHVFLTARTSTYIRSGLKPYVKHMAQSLSQGTETIYVFGLGQKIGVAKAITEEFANTDMRVSQAIPHYYRHKSIIDGNTVKGVCWEVRIYENDIVLKQDS